VLFSSAIFNYRISSTQQNTHTRNKQLEKDICSFLFFLTLLLFIKNLNTLSLLVRANQPIGLHWFLPGRQRVFQANTLPHMLASPNWVYLPIAISILGYIERKKKWNLWKISLNIYLTMRSSFCIIRAMIYFINSIEKRWIKTES